MRYLVRARVKPGREAALLDAIERGTLGAGSVAGDEYLRNMRDARLCDDGTARRVRLHRATRSANARMGPAVPRSPARRGRPYGRAQSAVCPHFPSNAKSV